MRARSTVCGRTLLAKSRNGLPATGATASGAGASSPVSGGRPCSMRSSAVTIACLMTACGVRPCFSAASFRRLRRSSSTFTPMVVVAMPASRKVALDAYRCDHMGATHIRARRNPSTCLSQPDIAALRECAGEPYLWTMTALRPIPLSVLDLSFVSSGSSGPQALRSTMELARLTDRLGYVAVLGGGAS